MAQLKKTLKDRILHTITKILIKVVFFIITIFVILIVHLLIDIIRITFN